VSGSALKGTIVNYHIGIRTQQSRECLIDFSKEGVSPSELGKLIGKKLVWRTAEKQITGRMISFHGRNGLILARFRRGLPGQALGATVEVVG
jgi:large subunit ribosomal protein L35Ae